MIFTDGEAAPEYRWLGGVFVIAAFAAFVGYFVDLNETTLHRFYRDRLMEAFMPDTDESGVPTGRRANAADAGRLLEMCNPASPSAPYHIICAHLVLTRIDTRGVDPKWLDRWRIRGGDSFVFSPRYCGGGAATPDLPELLTQGREDVFFRHLFDTKTRVRDAINEADLAAYVDAYRQPKRMSAGFAYYRAVPETARQNAAAPSLACRC